MLTAPVSIKTSRFEQQWTAPSLQLLGGGTVGPGWNVVAPLAGMPALPAKVSSPGLPVGVVSNLLQLQYAQMRSGIHCSAGQGAAPLQLSAAAAMSLYQHGMASAAARDACRWEHDTISKRQRAAAEFSVFLQTLPAAWGLNMMTARPLDIIMYSEAVWRHQHQGSWLPDGSKVASPSGHSSMLSMLSTTFSLLGRTGPWDPVQ
ncbi:hypothetical protein COCOBI_02-6640 [Coccomyxa sp. Obi]|nr:hypothetical protein COCOBI_02-6640 [Coccomyxa sp. Obi]